MRQGKRWSLVMALALLLVVSLAGGVSAQGEGVLEGLVANGTAGGPEVGSGISVTLHILQGEVEVSVLETTTDAEGGFRFEGLDTDPTLEYWPEATYLEVAYSPETPYQFAEGETTLATAVTVFETTDDDGAITLDSVHMIAESFGAAMRVSEIHLFGNSGDRTYIGDSEITLTIPVPEAAVGIAFGEGVAEGRFIEIPGALLDSEPVPPGSESSLAFFSYHLMVGGESIPVERRFEYPVMNLNLLAAQPGLTANSSQLMEMGVESFQGQQYAFYVGQGIEADSPLVIEFVSSADAAMAGMPGGIPAGEQASATTGTTRGNQELIRWLGIGLAALVVLGAVIYPFATRPPASAGGSEPDLDSNPAARRLVAELADLEDSFEAGQVDEETYERRRSEKYDELRTLLG